MSVRATADVRLDKRLLGTAHAGEPVAWAITALNHGPHRADGLMVIDPLPDALKPRRPRSSRRRALRDLRRRVARCTLHALALGERAEMRISGRLGAHTQAAPSSTTAPSSSSTSTDPAPRAAAHSDQVVVGPAADVEITGDATPMVPVPGSRLTYHVRVEDNGPAAPPAACTSRSTCPPG